MRSASDFLPFIISLFMKRVRVRLPNRGSAGTSRLITRARRGMLEVSLRRTIHGTSLVQAVQRTDRRAHQAHGVTFVQVPGWLNGLLPATPSPKRVGKVRTRYVSAERLVWMRAWPPL